MLSGDVAKVAAVRSFFRCAVGAWGRLGLSL